MVRASTGTAGAAPSSTPTTAGAAAGRRAAARWPDVGRRAAAGPAPARVLDPLTRPMASASATRCWHGWCAAGTGQAGAPRTVPAPGATRGRPTCGHIISRIRAVAAVFADDHAVSHLSAAALLGLPMPLGPPGPVHLTRLRACHRSRQAPDGVVIHHADSSVTPVVEHLGVRVTAVERTVADCVRTLAADGLGAPSSTPCSTGGWAMAPQLADYLEVQRRWAGDAPRPPGAVDGRRPAGDLARSRYSFVRLDRLGVPGWRAQVLVLDAGGELLGRVDGLWEDCAVVAEVDGRREVPRRRPRPDRGARGTGGHRREGARGRASVTSAWRWCAGTSPSCSSGRCNWPPGSSAHGPGATGTRFSGRVIY